MKQATNYSARNCDLLSYKARFTENYAHRSITNCHSGHRNAVGSGYCLDYGFNPSACLDCGMGLGFNNSDGSYVDRT